MDRAERRRQLKEDEKALAHGISPTAADAGQLQAMRRLLDASIAKAKQQQSVAPIIGAILPKVDATIGKLRDIPIACKKGCSHCCNIWVSASAPEILHIAKIVRQRGQRAIDKVLAAHAATKAFSFDERDSHPYPCPLVEKDCCTIYVDRPRACRLAASADAEICARSYNNITNEDIPMPAMFLMARDAYAMAFASALKSAGLDHFGYEFNSGLARALEYPDAEKTWLAGGEVFNDLLRDPGDATEHAALIFGR